MNRTPLLALLLLGGCGTPIPVTIARQLGAVGWFQADREMNWRPVDKAAGCQSIASSVREGEVIVIVPGIKGDGEEITALLTTVRRANPSAVFLYRWVPFDRRDAIAKGFAVGISHLLDCVPWIDGRLLVVAHSAGGVVVGYGATRLDVPARERKGPALYVVTVASPLSGFDDRVPRADGKEEARFVMEFGTAISGYPVPPTSMAAVHLRTRYPGDAVMEPTARHHLPNDSRIGIPGARQIELPAGMSHDGALGYVGEKIADGTWRTWFDESSASR